MADQLLPGRHRILLDCPRDRMPDLYRAMDVFVLPSLFEMMPIALLEAMASGLPCLVNRHPVLEWMIGDEASAECGMRKAEYGGQGTRSALASTEDTDAVAAGDDRGALAGGVAIDMASPGALAQALAGVSAEWAAARGAAARERAVRVFSKEAVIGQYIEYYQRVMDDGSPAE